VIPIPAGVRIWIASGYTDMRRGMRGLALQVQEGLGRDPFAGDIYIFRGRSGSLIKALWHGGLHGGASPGAPQGHTNGMWKHGLRSADAIERRRVMTATMRMIRQALT
jgi:transposase